jgi:hypothetical protein
MVRRFVSMVVAALVGLTLCATVALADATPVQLVLLYLPNVSNTDTQSASGIAELVMPEGEVRITAADLPRLDDGTQYVAWVVNTETNAFQRLGAFNAAEATGAVHYENVLPDAIPNKQWNLLLVTVEASADAARPGAVHSIAGVFPRADNAPLPGVLPNTGGAEETVAISCQLAACGGADWLSKLGLLALTLGVGFVAGYGVAKRRLSSANS